MLSLRFSVSPAFLCYIKSSSCVFKKVSAYSVIRNIYIFGFWSVVKLRRPFLEIKQTGVCDVWVFWESTYGCLPGHYLSADVELDRWGCKNVYVAVNCLTLESCVFIWPTCVCVFMLPGGGSLPSVWFGSSKEGAAWGVWERQPRCGAVRKHVSRHKRHYR